MYTLHSVAKHDYLQWLQKFKLYHYTVGQTHDYLPLLQNFKLQNCTIGQRHDYQPWLWLSKIVTLHSGVKTGL